MNEDPTVSSRDRQTAIAILDFVRPFPNLTRLEIDHTLLGKRKVKDARIAEVLAGVQVPGMTVTGEGPESEDEGPSSDDLSLQGGDASGDPEAGEGSGDDSSTGVRFLQGARASRVVEPTNEADPPDTAVDQIFIASNIGSIHIR